jgi:hypothetical protein
MAGASYICHVRARRFARTFSNLALSSLFIYNYKRSLVISLLVGCIYLLSITTDKVFMFLNKAINEFETSSHDLISDLE